MGGHPSRSRQGGAGPGQCRAAGLLPSPAGQRWGGASRGGWMTPRPQWGWARAACGGRAGRAMRRRAPGSGPGRGCSRPHSLLAGQARSAGLSTFSPELHYSHRIEAIWLEGSPAGRLQVIRKERRQLRGPGRSSRRQPSSLAPGHPVPRARPRPVPSLPTDRPLVAEDRRGDDVADVRLRKPWGGWRQGACCGGVTAPHAEPGWAGPARRLPGVT